MKLAMRLSLTVCLLTLALGLAQSVSAAPKSFVLLPFTVNAPQSYAYLSKAVPATMQARLNRPGMLEGRSAQARATSATEARKAMNGADYAVWGTVSVMGNECTIEVHSVDKAGKTWSKTAQGPLSGLTATVQQLSSALGGEVFGVTVAARPAFMTPGKGQPVNQMNSDILVNETGQQQVYLNPQFRYQGAGASDGSRLRSQRLKDNMVDMAVGDFNGDGKNEVAVLGDHKLTIYVWHTDGKLRELGSTLISQSNLNFSMRAIDLNRDGAQELVVATFEEDENRPYSYFYSFKGNKLSQYAERIPYFASVIRTPPTFTPTLVGQGWDSLKLFSPGVHVMVKSGNRFSLGSRLSLPTGATVFNVAWLPAGKDNHGAQLVMLTDDERIKVFQGNGNTLIHTTMERFSGSATGMDHYKGMPGLGVDRNYQLPSKYYAPMRMISADLGRTGEYVLLLNKPISTASQLFDRYRFFPQGEIHALYWDGVGLGLKWKTRRIRGSVAEIDLADVNNDGILDLVVGLNTSPDLGIGSRQSMITAYPLDVSQTDPNMPADLSDFEVNPN
ncbi:FG-GAP-like repeat-containing protein [Desulfovibrio sp. SGI.169]|uniref:FG-GAP-like repeat-containing protein n=1 Tax=Desulfovibrio sp. SGI.169 TaxID=3420561 RepID=UPI003D059480